VENNLCVALIAADGIYCAATVMSLAEKVKQAGLLVNAVVISQPHPDVYREVV
jgi:hypothetical protein